jgi:ABC-type transport system substrate-binding protein
MGTIRTARLGRRNAFARRVFATPFATLACLLLSSCGPESNAPYPQEWIRGKVLFTSFEERPKYLDPVSSYANNETPWTYSIYEPPLQYHYLKRPYVLEGRTTTALPEVEYRDAAGRRLAPDAPAERVATSTYTLRLIPGIRYQPHPSLARDAAGRLVYHDLAPARIAGRYSIRDFPLEDAKGSGVYTSTRELVAEDYVYQVKRLASPYVRTHSPVYGIMSEIVLGMKDLGDRLRAQRARDLEGRDPHDTWMPWHDLRADAFEGASAPDPHTFVLRVRGKYPQMRYWLAMVFFAPIPWEADAFYAQRGMLENGLSLNLWPVGTGPFMLVEQGPSRYVMKRNPHFRGQSYPTEGMPGDAEAGLLDAAGRTIPFLDMVVSSIEHERESSLGKFLQGYYDVPFVERSDAVFPLQKEALDNTGRAQLMREHGVRIISHPDANNWYMGFNWLDPVVGMGATPEQQERNRKLRQAISIATDWEEYATIFFDTYGESATAMGPLPPGVFGGRTGRDGMNPVTHAWQDGRAKLRPIEDARRLLAEAGYPDGRDARTGRPLVITYDANGVTPNYQARLDWQVKQAAKIGIQLEIRAADYNRFQERLNKGAHQIFFWGWLADYPDPENFLFLLYGPQARSVSGGENNANYANPEFDRLFNVMKDQSDGPARQAVIDRMVDIARADAIWMWGIFPGVASGYQPWVRNGNASVIVRDAIKYLDVDPKMRAEKLRQWNRPQWWPLAWIAGALALLAIPVVRTWRRRENRDARTALIWNASRLPRAARGGGAGGEGGEKGTT